MNHVKSFLSVAIAVAVLSAGPVYATALAPGATVIPESIAFASLDLGDGVADAEVHTAFTGQDALGATLFSGTLDQWVYLGSSLNGVSGVAFIWDITSDGSSIDEIIRITMTSFAGWIVEVAIVDEAGVEPVTAGRNASGSVVGFDYAVTQGIGAGESTVRLVIQTNAPTFTLGSTQVIDGAVASVQTFAPATDGVPPAVVPEPGSLLLLGSGLAAAGFLRRRRRS